MRRTTTRKTEHLVFVASLRATIEAEAARNGRSSTCDKPNCRGRCDARRELSWHGLGCGHSDHTASKRRSILLAY